MIRNISSLSLLLLSIVLLSLASCREDTEAPSDGSTQPTLTNPTVEQRGTPQRYTISVAFSVAEGQEDGVIHYVAIKEKDDTGMLAPQELLDHRFVKSIEMMGTGPRLLSIGADSKTQYYIYALLQIGEKTSNVVLLEAETI